MRMLFKVSVPVAAGNRAIQEGTLPKVIEETMARIKPEAAYFTLEGGRRTAFFFFEMQDSSQMPSVGEPAFMGLEADLTLTPVMNVEELKTGLAQAFAKR